jgi:S-adenosylmethionine synthetase
MIYTTESVTRAHPDKVCDQISDAILDAWLEQDPFSRVAIEAMGSNGLIVVAGELTTNAKINAQALAQQVYWDCGYTDDEVKLITNINQQSPEIKKGVDNDGAGDQGVMVGYACRETEELMPLGVILSRKLTKAMGQYDGKAQVTIDNGKIINIITSVCGTDGERDKNLELIIQKELAVYFSPAINNLADIWLKNPNGSWEIGGFRADTGLTGRKLVIDNYGPNIPIGGGAFSGKDATKVDRSGAYMARKIAVDYINKTDAREVFVHIAYAIGVAEPVMAVATLDGKQEKIKNYDLRPQAIIEYLELRKPQFQQTAQYGHFGNGFKWDK